jgi:hypothetical protein
MSDDELLQTLAEDGEIDDELEQPRAVQLTIKLQKGETVALANARVALTPEYHAAYSICELNQVTAFKEAELTELADRLAYQLQQLKDGDLGQVESMLASQAYTLDAMFHNLLRRSTLNFRNEFSVIERFIKLAMKAQSQCRTTLDSLASMKKPPPELIKQTIIAHGHQQVNNFPEKENPPNELLEKTDGERLEFGAAATPIRGDQGVETVEQQHRAKNKRRQD